MICQCLLFVDCDKLKSEVLKSQILRQHKIQDSECGGFKGCFVNPNSSTRGGTSRQKHSMNGKAITNY